MKKIFSFTKKKKTPVRQCSAQHDSCVKILLENHAEPNLVDINGNTALHLSANIPSMSTTIALLEHEADINAHNKEGFTPLIVAVREDHIEMAEFLLKERADINIMDQSQRSALMLAAGNGQISMLRLLLRFDADITIKDTKGWSADDYAVMNGHHPCSLLIIEHGTQKNEGPSVSNQGLSKKKTVLGSPSQNVEAGFSLGGPAIDKDDFEDNSQSESLSRVSKSAADEWASSDDDDESVLIEKKPSKVNLRKMIASKRGKASAIPDKSLSATESEPESENRVQRIPSLLKALPSSKAPKCPVDPSPISFLSKAPQMSSTPLQSYKKIIDAENIPGADTPYSRETSPGIVGDSEKDATVHPSGTISYALPATDCIVSAIRVESKFSDEDDSLGSKGGPLPSRLHTETSPAVVKEEEGEMDKDDNSWSNGSPVPEGEKATTIHILDNDEVETSQKEDRLKSEKEEGDDSSWDDEDESNESEKQKSMGTKDNDVEACGNVLETNHSTPNMSRPTSAIDNKLEGDEDNEKDQESIIDGKDQIVENNGLEEEDKLVDVDKDNEGSEDSDSQDQRLLYDFASATVKVSDDEDEARLTSYVPLENSSAIVSQTRVSSDDLNEEPTRTNMCSSPHTVDQHRDSDGNASPDDEALPQTDIDDVDVVSPDEAESLGMNSQEVRNIDEPVIQFQHCNTSTPVETDFLSELGLEQGEEEQDSWDSESHSENPKIPQQEKQSSLIKVKEEVATVEEDLFYIPSFLREEGGNRILEPRRSVGRPRGSQGEVGNNHTGDNRQGDVEKDDGVQKETEKSKWEPLRVLSKLEADHEQQTDLMEELGLGDVDDLEDASDWDSASTASKRTLPGRRMPSPGLEESPECTYPPKEQEENLATAAPPTTPRSINPNKTSPSTPPQPVPQPQPRAKKMVPAKPESEEESDWEQDNVASTSNTAKVDNQLQNLAELQIAVTPGSPELPPKARDTKTKEESDQEQQKVGKDTRTTAMEVHKSSTFWDSGGTALEEVGTEKPETRLGGMSIPAGAIHQEKPPAAIKSTNEAPVQLRLPLQQTYNSSKQEGPAVEETLQLELVRGASRSRAPQTNAHVNGDPLSVFDDSTLSEVSDDEGRFPVSGQQRNKNPEEVEMAEDFDELTQSSDTATDDSPTSGYRHASLLIQKLDSATLDSRSMVKLQNIFHEYERSIQKARSRHGYLSDKVSQLEMERAELNSSLEEVKEVKSALERSQLELQSEVPNLKFQLKQEQEHRRNATMMYNTTRDQLRRMEEQHQGEVQDKQKVELTLRNLELEMRTLVNSMKQLEEDHSETQRLLAQERSARTLQENLLSSHLRKQQEIEHENKRNISKSNEALSQLTEASDRERELLQQTATFQEQLSILRADLERSQANSSLKESHLLEENEHLKEQLEDARRDLKLNSEALTQTVFNCNNQLTALKSEFAMTRKGGGALPVSSHRDRESSAPGEREEHQRLKDRLTGEVANQRESVSSLSQKLSKAETRANSLENEVHRATLQLTEKSLLLDVLQREKDQEAARVKSLEAALQVKEEQVNRAGARQEAAQERLAQTQSESMLLRQQLEESQNKGVAKERAVTDAHDRFSDLLSQLRSDSEERVQLVEERSKELASKAAEFREQLYKNEELRSERETTLRHLQQELADSLKKLSMSEATLEVNTRYRNDLEEEKARLFKDLERLRGKVTAGNSATLWCHVITMSLMSSVVMIVKQSKLIRWLTVTTGGKRKDQYVQAERRINGLKSSLDEREKELCTAVQKHQEALLASAASDTTIKQREEAMQRLEIENARLEAAAKQQANRIEALQKGAQESAMVRGHLEELVTNLQSSKMTLEDQLNRE
ncbi:hypothetical protein KUCAC02_021057, partial [Chaenocephalus aceratus]